MYPAPPGTYAVPLAPWVRKLGRLARTHGLLVHGVDGSELMEKVLVGTLYQPFGRPPPTPRFYYLPMTRQFVEGTDQFMLSHALARAATDMASRSDARLLGAA
jgi:hypothetical protein